MASGPAKALYRSADVAQVRAARHAEIATPQSALRSTSSISSAIAGWPDFADASSGGHEEWRPWLRDVWSVDAIAEVVELASPALAQQVAAVCAGKDMHPRQLRRMALSIAKYLLRMTSRATPFGLFAGVASASFGRELGVHWGRSHRATAQVDAAWLTEIVADLETSLDLIEHLTLVTNNLCFVRGYRLVVPYPARLSDQDPGAVEVSLQHTPAVQLIVEGARSPVGGGELAGKLAAHFPTVAESKITGLLTDLIARRVLLSTLHAPSTIPDPLGHLVSRLETANAVDIPRVVKLLNELRNIHRILEVLNRATSLTPARCRATRAAVAKRMSAVHTATGPPLAVDLRVDCELTLPGQVMREAERAASALARLSPHPFGSPAWKAYHTQFFERYGVGALVPLLDVVNPDIGIGFPAGYLGGDPEPPQPLTTRDQRLLAIAQASALEARDEVALDDDMLADLAVAERQPVRWPPHLELCFQLQASSNVALDRGEFALSVVSASRGAGTMSGRFTHLLEPSDQARTADLLANLPRADPDALPVQLSFPPLSMGNAHVARAPQLLPLMVSLGEHHEPSQSILEPTDLAVGCSSQRLYLVSLSRQRRLEPLVFHALDLRTHAPPLARFLAEIGRAHTATVTGFDWGAAANLPFLPRLRYRRTILSPACWLLNQSDLPGYDVSWSRWRDEFAARRTHRRMPRWVYLTQRDQRLRLDLDEPGHLGVLREHLGAPEQAILTEAPLSESNSWFGDRAHEIVVPMTATATAVPSWPSVPPVSTARVIGRDHGQLPGASRWLYAKLYGHAERQSEILTDHLPTLLAQWTERGETPTWWFIRYRDPKPHLRLRIALPDANDFGVTAQQITSWAGLLRRDGLLGDLQFATSYPETGRWGTGPLLAAAEKVFSADASAVITQFADRSQLPQLSELDPRALVTANFVAISVGFTGSIEAGIAWLVDHAKTAASPAQPLTRSLSAEAIRLSDPTEDWAAMRALPGGHALLEAWRLRDRALRAYRNLLAEAGTDHGVEADAVLDSLLHAHYIRAIGIDRGNERACLRLARSSALAWQARHVSDRQSPRALG